VTTIAITANPSGIATGTTCTGTVVFIATTTNATQTVTVTMTSGTASGSGNVTVSPTTLTFAYTQGQSLPAAQTVNIANVNTATAPIPLTISVAETNGATVNWLQVNKTSGVTPLALSVSVAPGSLAPATYTGTITVSPNGGALEPIDVTMTVTATATVTASPTTVTWTYLAGSSAPTPATIAVSAGGAVANFTATASSTGGWLQVSPTSGATPNTGTTNLTVSTVASALSALMPSGTPYTGTVTIQGVSQGNNQATGTTVINVSLAVTAPFPVISGITNAASGASGSVAPGEIISIYGSASNPIGPASQATYSSGCTSAASCNAPTTLGGVQVFFLPGEEPAPLLFVDESQINAIVPYTVAGISSLAVEVKYLGQTSNDFPVSLATTFPGLFTANDSGTGQAAADQVSPQGVFSQNLPAAPASAGWTLVLYLTGEGSLNTAVTAGTVTAYNPNANPPVPVPLVKPNVLIGNQPANVTFYGEAPGLVSGVLQINVVVPAGAGTGPVPVSVSMGNNSSQAGVTVYLQ